METVTSKSIPPWKTGGLFSRIKKEGKMHRRDFLKGALASFALKGRPGLHPSALSSQSQNQEVPRIKEFRTLGRTGFRVSDLSAGQVFEEGIMRTMLERGVNFIDTSELYERNSHHETLIGSVIKDFERKSLFITTKLWPENQDTKESFLKRARKCIERLRLDTLDCLMLHSPDSSAEVKNEQFLAAVKELKAEGRLKYAGVSCHGSRWFNKTSETMEQILGTAVEDGRFDVVLVAYSYLNQDQGKRILKACREKGIGTTVMKTDPTGGGIRWGSEIAEKSVKEGKELQKWEKDILQFWKENQDKARQFMQDHGLKDLKDAGPAAIRFVLDNPDVATAVLTVRTYEEMERILSLSGSKFSISDRRLLDI
jgi:aryl-alcohol dehydrogenase-like predicted oxidoreductase